MKRTAETQLTRDSADNDADAEEGTGGFQKADADSLATRKIRALPKRPPSTAATGFSSQPTSTDSSAPGGSRFGGFTGFGVTPSNADDVKSTITKSQPSFPSSVGLGSTRTASTSTNPPGIPSTSGLTNVPTAYQNASTLASEGDSAPKTPTPTTLTKYFTDLRGLNNSFAQAVKSAVEADPLADLSGLAESYRTHREAIQKERDASDSKQTPQTATSTPSAPSTAAPAVTAFAAPSTKFTFGYPNPAPAPQTAIPSTSWSISSSSSTDNASSPTFSFGAPKTPSTTSFVFGGSSSTEGASIFKAAATTNAGEKQGAEISDKSSGSSTTVNFFNPQSAPITPGISSFLSPPSRTAGFNSQPSAASTSFTFESSKKGNIGNPLGFSFGGPSNFSAFPSTMTASAAIGSDTTSSGLLDVPAAKDEASTEGDESATAENVQTESTIENQYDKDGAGEEGEETQFETRSKAYVSLTAEDGKKSWSPVGTGQLKLKKQKEGAKRRLLMRNSSNGKIIINTLLGPGFKLTVEGKTISFIVPNSDGTADLWKLRLSTEADAKEWEVKVSEK